MYFLKEYKSILCILLVVIFIFAFSTIVTSATIDDMDSFTDLEAKNTANSEDDYEDIATMDDEEEKEDKNQIASSDKDEEENNDNKDSKQEEKNDIKEVTKTEQQNTSGENLSEAGIEDAPIMIIIALFAIASIYAYIKTKN